MIESLIQIEAGAIENFRKKWGFVYVDADERTAPDERDCEASMYAEQAGENIDPRTVDAPFDYTAKFFIEAPNKDLTNVNAKINAFNKAIRKTSLNSDIKYKREVTFYNLLNRVKIVGYPDVVKQPEEVHHSNRYGEMDFAIVELKIRVSDPRKCDFNLNTDNL